MISSDFRITVGSDTDHEDLAADITYQNAIVCYLTQEEGYENLKIEFNLGEGVGRVIIPLKGFEEAIAQAKKRLWELRRIEK